MRKIVILSPAAILISMNSFLFAESQTNSVSKEKESIGTVAGEHARDLKIKAEEGYKVASEKAVKSSQEIQVAAKDAFAAFNVQAQEAYRKFQDTMAVMVQNFQMELDKFNRAFNQPANDKPAANKSENSAKSS